MHRVYLYHRMISNHPSAHLRRRAPFIVNHIIIRLLHPRNAIGKRGTYKYFRILNNSKNDTKATGAGINFLSTHAFTRS